MLMFYLKECSLFMILQSKRIYGATASKRKRQVMPYNRGAHTFSPCKLLLK